ncbi:MAG: ATP-binding protein [Clostridia bacterium]|nr:ATP-binding protein [Clostridia bacterium]
MKTEFEINPPTNLIDVLGHSGYTFEAAIADIIDNSISANAKNITICFDDSYGSQTIYILDDGDGMDRKKLNECLIPAYQSIYEARKEGDLGRYSLGLKSATKSFCSDLYVCSKIKNGIANTVELDFEHLKTVNKWVAYNLDDFYLSHLLGEHGTIVVWDKINLSKVSVRVDSDALYETLDKLEKKLSHTFGKYIIEDGLNIYIQKRNNKKHKIEGWDPFFLPENRSTNKIYSENKNYKNSKITFNTYILPTYTNLSEKDQKYFVGRGAQEQQGFYIYRNKRLIQEGGWLDLQDIKLEPKCNSCRIEVNIGTNLDEEFDVNFGKDKITVPTELKSLFISIAKSGRTEASKNFNYKKSETKIKQYKEKNIPVWNVYKTNDGIKLTINDKHPIIKDVLGKLPSKEVTKLVTLLTKTLPVSELAVKGGYKEEFKETDINILIKDTFEQLMKQNNNDLEKTKKQILKTEPFVYYKDLVIDFIIKKTGEKDE